MKNVMKTTTVIVRRFEMGASGVGLDNFLQDRGYVVNTTGVGVAIKKIGAPGRAKGTSRRKMLDLLDQLRIAEGLEPIVKANRK